MRFKFIFSQLFLCFLTVSASTTYLLKADGKTETYSLISQAGYFAETSGNQTPDEFMMHPEFKHISQVYDSELGEYVFAFDIHVDYKDNGVSVTDGNKSELVDRQRNEIKCMDNLEGTVAADGQTIRYRWKFRLPEGMKTTSEFCHIHQIKGMGSGPEVAHPVFTLTCRSISSKQVLQVINVPYEGASNVNLAQTDLKPLLGKWIEATEVVTVGKNGAYYLELVDIASGKSILKVDKKDIEVWRDTSDKSTMRGKWGIYRSLGDNLKLKGQLRSERLLFADFESVRMESGSSGISPVECDIDGEGIYYDLTGRQIKNPVKGIYIKNGRKIIIN